MGVVLLAKNNSCRIDFLYILIAVLAMAVMISAGILFWLSKNRTATVFLFALICGLLLLWPFTVSVDTDENNVIRDFARSASIVAGDKKLIGYCEVNASFVYYCGRDVEVICDVDEIYHRYANGVAIIATGDEFEQLKKDGRFLLVIVGADDGRGLFMNK